MFKKKKSPSEPLNECQRRTSLVDLPDVQFFVFFNAFVDLSGSEALVGTSFHDGRHLDHLVIAS